MSKENKLVEFQNATVSTIRAIASKKLNNREIQFFGNVSSYNSKQITLPKINDDYNNNDLIKTRGESDQVSLKLKFHDKKIHSRFKPTSELASSIFDLAEETRIETIGSKKYIGIKDNINTLIEKKFKTNLISPPGSEDTSSFINAFHLY